MFAELAHSPYLIAALITFFLGTLLTIAGIAALFRAKVGAFVLQALSGISLVTIGLLLGMISLGIQGYHALTREEVAANITVSPITPQRFAANFRFPDGKVSNFIIAGDEIYIDADILKWQPIANILGLHTAYELDRIGGRYRDIEQEKNAERTLFSLKSDKPVNLMDLRLRHAFLSILFDAKYGSATYIPVTQPAELELRVSTTGLILRESAATSK
jgi:hypothetical protein